MPCSFCRGSHNINKCNSERLTELNTNLAESLEHGSRYILMMLESLTLNELKVMCATRFKSKVNRNATCITYIFKLMDTYFLDWRLDGSADGRPFNQAEVDAQANEMFRLMIDYMTVKELDPVSGQMMYDNVIVPTYLKMSRQATVLYTQLAENYRVNRFNETVKPPYSITLQQTTEKIPVKATQDCDVCMECIPTRKFVVFNCKHELCGTCVSNLLKSASTTKRPSCHMCRAVMTNFTAKSTPTFKAVMKILV